MNEPIFEISYYNPKTKKLRARLHPSARAKPQPWRWPLPRLSGRDPVAVHVGEDERGGVDIGYAGHNFGSELFVPVYAVQRGEVSVAIDTSTGFAITIDHGAYSSHYSHLSKMFVIPGIRRTRRRELVQSGQVIGYAAKAPIHVRFELSEATYTMGFRPVDPVPHLNDWMVSPSAEELRTPASGRADDKEAA
jgi:murein DD-endopeptidase MepM/ murein hydrolase activator NlpD